MGFGGADFNLRLLVHKTPCCARQSAIDVPQPGLAPSYPILI
jgi:hypothetical protein